jgi:HSP20 family molecular chaperone IbpA
MFDKNFFDALSDMFGLSSYKFTRPTLDQRPYKAYPKDDGLIIVVNTLGISKKDILVELTNNGLPNGFKLISITGATKIPQTGEENKISLELILKFNVEIEKISYEVKDGFTYIYIKVESPKEDEKNSIRVEYEESPDTDF